MIYDGKKASLVLQEQLKLDVDKLEHKPILAIVSVSTHPSIVSFIKIKRKFGDAIGVAIKEYSFLESFGEENLIKEIQNIINKKEYTSLIVQLPLPSSYNAKQILDTIPKELDADVLGKDAWESFIKDGNPIPPVAGAVAHILKDTNTDIKNKKIVIIGQGILVGLPVTEWFKQQNIEPIIVDVNTNEEERIKAYREADIVISGIGKPHHLKKEFFKEGVILIDAGTSEQAGVLAGDIDPSCEEIANIITRVPGGVGPLTVAHLFENIINFIKK